MIAEASRVTMVVAAAAFVSYAAREARSVRITQRDIYLARLPAVFDGLKILHLSDFHLRKSAGFSRVVESAVRGVHANLVAITGDVTCCGHGVKAFQGILAAIKDCMPSVPIFACTGNSEIIYREAGARTLEAIAQSGGVVLRNANTVLEKDGDGLYILGVDDPFTRKDDLDRALEGVPEDGFKMLLAHSPSIALKAARAGIDLMLAGHTHGGQFRLPWIGAVYARTGFRRAISAGLYEGHSLRRAIGLRRGEALRTKLYVSRGIGTSHLPLRFLCPPDLAVLTLRRDAAAGG